MDWRPGGDGMTEKAEESGEKPWYSAYVLLLMGLVAIANYYDRNLITVLVEPMKRDLGLSDGQIGLLSGIGFAFMYSVLGIPLARIADRVGRAKVLASVVAIWSVMTALSGRTVSFTTMLLARAGVGIGEAGGLPASHALIADYFSPRWRGTALSIIGVCAGIGISLAEYLGGMLADGKGWRMAFYVAGAPGLILSALIFFTVREPKAALAIEQAPDAPSLGEAFRTLWNRKAFVYLCLGLAVAAIGAYGQQAWGIAFLMRAYHMTPGEVGKSYSAITGPASIVATLLGGVLND